MLYALIALFIIVILLAVLYVLAWRNANRLRDALGESLQKENEAVLAYRAIDQGFTEITDAYETDSLQYESTIENLHEELGHAQTRIAEKHEKILRRNATIDSLQIQVANLRRENDGVRRQLDIAQTIISEHDLNCLPHVVLSSMENHEKDTPLPL